jgi:hypothetical protein
MGERQALTCHWIASAVFIPLPFFALSLHNRQLNPHYFIHQDEKNLSNP